MAHVFKSAEKLDLGVFAGLRVQAGFQSARGLKTRHRHANEDRFPGNADTKDGGLHRILRETWNPRGFWNNLAKAGLPSQFDTYGYRYSATFRAHKSNLSWSSSALPSRFSPPRAM